MKVGKPKSQKIGVAHGCLGGDSSRNKDAHSGVCPVDRDPGVVGLPQTTEEVDEDIHKIVVTTAMKKDVTLTQRYVCQITRKSISRFARSKAVTLRTYDQGRSSGQTR